MTFRKTEDPFRNERKRIRRNLRAVIDAMEEIDRKGVVQDHEGNPIDLLQETHIQLDLLYYQKTDGTGLRYGKNKPQDQGKLSTMEKSSRTCID
jgi:hypothetical protein